MLSLGVASGSILALPLSILTALPLAFAGIGFGTVAAIVAAACAALVISIASASGPGLFAGLGYLISTGAPAAWIAHLVGLSRSSDTDPSERVWFPLSAVLLRAALASAVSVVIALSLLGFDPSSWTESVTNSMVAVFADGGPAAPTRSQIESTVQAFVAVLPFLVGAWSVVTLVFNIWLGGRIVRASNLLERPWTPLWTIFLPKAVVLILALLVVASFFPLGIGIVTGAFAGALAGAFALTGFGYVHALLQGRPNKNALLWLLYLVSFALSGLAFVVMALVGVADSFFGWRSRLPQMPTLPPTARPRT
ncbi:MAG: DUF2232 domain-containing protein [Rhizobiales bacterium]|nr:DUF2232 domain-containing protein [Hyphomicrobiales bacterium]